MGDHVIGFLRDAAGILTRYCVMTIYHGSKFDTEVFIQTIVQ
jgi:hypothetical protein